MDEEPPVRGPHTPLLPNLDTDADEEDDDPLTAPAAPRSPPPSLLPRRLAPRPR